MSTKILLNRIITFTIALSLLLPFGLTGCKTEENAVKSKIDHVYKAEFIEMPEEAQNLERLFMSDGKLYFTEYAYTEEKNQTLLYSMNQDGTNLTELLAVDNNESYLTALVMMPDGTIWTVFNSYSVNEETGEYSESFTMIKYSPDGAEQFKLDLKDIIPDREYLYINSLTADSKGNLYFVIEDSVYILDSEAKPKQTVKIENGYINTVKVDASDNVFIIYNDNTSYKTTVKILDPDNGSLGDSLSLGTASNFSYSMTTGGEGSLYDFYYNNSVALCGFKFDTLESVELCNWINSDVNGDLIGHFLVVNDDKIICTMYDDVDNKQKLLVLNRVPEEQVVEKYILTLAGIYVDYNTRSAIIAFNRANEEYRITIKDYSVYNTGEGTGEGTGEQALTALNNDIIAGKIPDILQVGYNMPTDSYIAKGLFADLNEYIEKDESIDRSEYLTNVFDALSVNGRLYELTPAFSIRTVSGKQSIVGSASGWTMDEFNAVLDKYPESMAFYDVTQSTMLDNICTITADQFIDKNSGKCSFDSDGFIKILKFTKTLNDKSIWEMENSKDMGEDYWTQMQTAHRENRVLLQIEYFNNFRQYWELMKGTYGEEINLIGFPTDNRNGSAISPSFKLAMSSKTKLPEGAWQFMRYFLTDEYQDTITYDFPVKLSRLEALAAEAMKPHSWTDETTGEVHEYPSTWWTGNESVEIGEITQEYVDMVMNSIRSLNQVVRYDNDMMSIINEEATAFFADSKSAEETAKIIQNRISIYISESR